MKKYRKSNWLSLVLFIYVTAMAVYLVPRNTEISMTEKVITVSVSYVIVILLWFVLRKKEQLVERRKRDEEERKENKK